MDSEPVRPKMVYANTLNTPDINKVLSDTSNSNLIMSPGTSQNQNVQNEASDRSNLPPRSPNKYAAGITLSTAKRAK